MAHSIPAAEVCCIFPNNVLSKDCLSQCQKYKVARGQLLHVGGAGADGDGT